MNMHNGEIGGYERIRRALESMIPDDLYPHRLGTTDSEAFFLLLLGNGLEDDPIAATERTVAAVLRVMKEYGVTQPFRMTSTLTDGHNVYALRFASDDLPPSLYWWPGQQRLIIVSEPLDTEADHWQVVPESSMLISAGRGDTVVLPFRAKNGA
jgi:glutamine amidotransferase